MNTVILMLMLFSAINSFTQTSGKFKPGVELIENNVLDSTKKSKSILFVFEDHTHFIDHYLNLAKKLKRAFKKSEVTIDFEYRLSADNPLPSDLELIPKESPKTTGFDAICTITTAQFKFWDDHLITKRKQNHNLIFELIQEENKVLIETGKINIKTYYTISTENKKLSVLLHNLLVR